MIKFEKFVLSNGLRVLVHKDNSTPIAAVNLLYDVGSRDENPEMTGFAHLFEHLMFGGSIHVPSFDNALQLAGGENNAFTSSDVTNYHLTLPKENLETAFWLESDRMLSLDFSEKSLSVQQNVVIEEFKQRYLNQPYGDVWLLLSPLAYKIHPYLWPTIGKDIEHIRKAELSNVKDFFFSHYAPNNAILVVAGDVETDQVRILAEKWFGPIEKRLVPQRNLPMEPKQSEKRIMHVERDVPFDSIYRTYHICERLCKDFYVSDLISDALSLAKSSRLFLKLVKERQLFSSIDADMTGNHDPGLIIVSGNLMEGVSFEEAEKGIDEEIAKISTELLEQEELNKLKNQKESQMIFGQMNVLNKAMALAFGELLGDANLVNTEIQNYRDVTAEEIKNLAAKIFVAENSSTLYYHSKK